MNHLSVQHASRLCSEDETHIAVIPSSLAFHKPIQPLLSLTDKIMQLLTVGASTVTGQWYSLRVENVLN